MITGGATNEDRLRAIAEGVTDFVAKPFAAEELLARLKALVRMKRFTDALEHAEHVIVALARAIDARDPYTAKHSERVSTYAGRLGAAIGLTDLDLEAVRRGGLFHDIGKIATRDAVLLKPGRLTPEEFAEIRGIRRRSRLPVREDAPSRSTSSRHPTARRVRLPEPRRRPGTARARRSPSFNAHGGVTALRLTRERSRSRMRRPGADGGICVASTCSGRPRGIPEDVSRVPIDT